MSTEQKTDPVKLTTFCGLYCGACDIYQKRISIAGGELKKILKGLDFSEIAAQIPGFEKYEAFDETLSNLIAFFGSCPTCRNGGGPPTCAIRSCAKEKGFQTCAGCNEFPCDKLSFITEGYPEAEENLRTIREIGVEKWAQSQQERVEQGFRYSDMLSHKKG